MIRHWTLIFLVSALLGACASSVPTPSPAQVTSPSPGPSGASSPTTGSADPASIGTAFIEALSRGDWAGAQAMEDPVMAAAAPAAQLQQIAQQLATQYGDFKSIGTVTTTTDASGTAAAVPVTFANATVTLNVSVNAIGQVIGLHIGSVVTPSASPAAYVESDSFNETSVTVGSAPWLLPGTLTMPNGTGPFPAVVLVAGSGPEDRDETFGPNKPFRDLAWGLASQGIVVLRYDKRTLVYGAQMATDPSITVRQETTDDAEAALELLRKTPKVDPARVFVVGHSLGAYLAPRVAAQVPGELAGIAMLETPSTPVAQLMVRQVEYLVSLQGSPSPQDEQQLATLRAQLALVESPSLSPSTPAAGLPFSTPASYWLDLRTYDPLGTAATLRIPMLFVQGGRDYQVPASELGAWRQALAGRGDVRFREYPALDHLLFAGSGPSTPTDYGVPGQHVAQEVVADISSWIASL